MLISYQGDTPDRPHTMPHHPTVKEPEGAEYYEMLMLKLFSITGSIVALGNCVTFMGSFVGAVISVVDDTVSFSALWFQLFLNLYGFTLAFSVILIEFRYEPIMERCPVFKHWAPRGFYYIFVALLALQVTSQQIVFSDPSLQDTWSIVNESFAYVLLCIGGVYIIGELLCLRKSLQKVKKKYVKDGPFFEASLV